MSSFTIFIDSDVKAQAEIEVLPPTRGLDTTGVLAGIHPFPPLVETGDARVNDLSLGLYAPSNYALVVKVTTTACVVVPSLVLIMCSLCVQLSFKIAV